MTAVAVSRQSSGLNLAFIASNGMCHTLGGANGSWHPIASLGGVIGNVTGTSISAAPVDTDAQFAIPTTDKQGLAHRPPHRQHPGPPPKPSTSPPSPATTPEPVLGAGSRTDTGGADAVGEVGGKSVGGTAEIANSMEAADAGDEAVPDVPGPQAVGHGEEQTHGGSRHRLRHSAYAALRTGHQASLGNW
ncbi:hypothetical protein ACFU7Y_33495 [Kitasatospora sp. NPDC057542]|uniref:hypothetical protein n=1 Tax=Kitasatospora sp. NPDC057542 TaxID=3346162 RepID=UPI003673A6C8